MGRESRRTGVPPMSLSRAYNIADLRRAAQRALPLPIFDYMDGGADDERTLGATPPPSPIMS